MKSFSPFLQNSYHSLHGIVSMLSHNVYVISDTADGKVTFTTKFFNMDVGHFIFLPSFDRLQVNELLFSILLELVQRN
jgi:hypothetical protein